MKRLHWLILRSFLGPFLATFFIAMFFLVMQFLWKYIDDLLGKGLEIEVILNLLLYACADLVPMALPLAILISSIMLFGRLGEQNELTAMKSAGMSLFRIASPLIVFVVMLSVGAFFFSNYTWPSAHFKMRVMINDIAMQKASFNIKEGEAYDDIEGYIISVDRKIDDSNFEGVSITDYNNADQTYLWREIIAEKANMRKSRDGRTLLVTLYNGFSDEELNKRFINLGNYPFRHTDFKKLNITMDLSDFEFNPTDADAYRESILFKTYQQLTQDVDSLEQRREEAIARANRVIKNKLFLFRDTNQVNLADVESKPLKMEGTLQARVLDVAGNTLNQSRAELTNKAIPELTMLDDVLRHVNIARNRVFTLSIAIIILFFIGAPLGAISKKGGIGYPVVFATIFFVVYYMLSIAGEKMAKSAVMSPFWGMWFSSLILAPIAMFLTYKANRDSVLFDKEFYKKLLKTLPFFRGR